MSSDGITKRGNKSWRIKFEIGRDPVTGKRRTAYETFRGTKLEAKAQRAKRLTEVYEAQFVERSAKTVADYANHWITNVAPVNTSNKTRERYQELIAQHVIPRLGTIPLQKLDSNMIEAFYARLRTAGRKDGKGGLSPQTVLHVHRLLSQILSSAVFAKKLPHSPMLRVQTAPKAPREREIQILLDPEVVSLYRHLKGKPLYLPVVTAGSTGIRRGELLGLRWKDVDLAAGTLQVAQVVEQTKDAIGFKVPKTPRSRRTITLPATLVEHLRAHKVEQAAWRLKNGMGKDPDALVFPDWNGGVRDPRRFSKQFTAEVKAAKLPHVTFHGLRHTHITDLLRRGVPVHVVSARAGHANPTVTLNIYAHLLPGQQEAVATAIDGALRSALEE